MTASAPSGAYCRCLFPPPASGPDLLAVGMPRLAAVPGVQSSIPAVVVDPTSRRLMVNAAELT